MSSSLSALPREASSTSTNLFHGESFNDVYPELIHAIRVMGNEVPSRVALTKELHPVWIEVSNPLRRLITSWGRPINVAFALAEVLWILTGSKEVERLSFYNSRIGEYSDNGISFNAAYGYRLRVAHGYDQINDVIRTLQEDPYSRQATLTLWHPDDRGYDLGLKRETKDRACNLLSRLLVRDGQLDWIQVQRSNDAIWGTPYNWMQFTHLQEWIAAQIGVAPGKFFHMVDSLHIYDYHFEDAAGIAHFDLYKELMQEHMAMKIANIEVLTEVVMAEHHYRTSAGTGNIPNVTPYWNGVLGILKAHALFKAKDDTGALKVLLEADPIYGAAQARFYYASRWHKDKSMTALLRKIDNWPMPVVGWITGNAPQ